MLLVTQPLFIYICLFFLFVPGFVPISYLCRHIGERNFRMRHRYLGGMATKPLALAFQVLLISSYSHISTTFIKLYIALKMQLFSSENKVPKGVFKKVHISTASDEILRNNNLLLSLHILFKCCFDFQYSKFLYFIY